MSNFEWLCFGPAVEQNRFDSLILTQVSEPGPVMYWFEVVAFLFSLVCIFGPMNLVFDTKSMTFVHEKSVGLALGWAIVSVGLDLLIFSIYNFIVNSLIPFFKQYIIRRWTRGQIWSDVRTFWCAVSECRKCDNLDFFQESIRITLSQLWWVSLLTIFPKLYWSWFNKCTISKSAILIIFIDRKVE